MNSLNTQHCQPCQGNVQSVCQADRERWLAELPGWQCVQQDGVWQLQKSFPFRQYQPGLAFVNQVADLAEQEQHHPAMLIEWGLVNVRWWTHSIGDLHLNDFIMAAKTQALIDAKNA
jgi:4a-hydroxytetrahydrobiopterin dehydratase